MLKGKMINKVGTFLSTSFTIACLIHVAFIGYYIIYPELPDIKIYSKDLKDITFPLVFRLCAQEHQNPKEKYRKIGYDNSMEFFIGRSMYSWKHYGWNGHKKGNKVIGSLENIMQRISYDWKRSVFEISLIDQNEVPIKREIKTWNILPIYPDCQIIDIAENFNLSEKVSSFIPNYKRLCLFVSVSLCVCLNV